MNTIVNPLHFMEPLPLSQMIRLGRNQDGGYVVYGRILTETDGLLSYGVGWDISFEEHFQRLTQKSVHMFDPTMRGNRFMIDFSDLKNQVLRLKLRAAASYLIKVAIFWWKRKSFVARDLHFFPEGIAATKKKNYDTLEAHINRYGLAGKNSMLKIDIEGAEYSLFEEDLFYASLKHFNQLIIEWHHLETRLDDLKSVLARLQDRFVVIHVHGNNWGRTFQSGDGTDRKGKRDRIPDVIEMTLLRRDRIHPRDICTQPAAYPVEGLDYPNNSNQPDYRIDFTRSGG